MFSKAPARAASVADRKARSMRLSFDNPVSFSTAETLRMLLMSSAIRTKISFEANRGRNPRW